MLFLCAVGQTYRNSVCAYLDLTGRRGRTARRGALGEYVGDGGRVGGHVRRSEAGFAFATDNVIASEGTVEVGDLMDAVLRELSPTG